MRHAESVTHIMDISIQPCCSFAHRNWVCKSIRLQNISPIILPKWSNDVTLLLLQ